MLGTSMAAIDTSIVNVSLPVIRKEFNVDIADIEWVVTAYMISFCLFIPMTNWLKKRVGYYYLFLGSLLIFTAGSLLCSLSQSLHQLVAARVIQAVGGGIISPVSLAILSESYPADKRGSAIGWWGIGNVMGPALGPTLGGVLTHYFGWESIFWVNIPMGVLTIFFTSRYLKFLKLQPNSKPAFDVGGYIYFAIFIIAIQYTVSVIPKNGFGSRQLICGVITTIISLKFFLQSAKKAQPLIDLSVYKSPVFVKAAIIIVIRSVALYGGMFFLPFLLQGLLGYTAIQSGLILLPNALMMLVTRPFAGRMADKGFIRNISVVGILIVSISFFLFSRIEVGAPLWLILLPMLIRGVGMSFLVAPVSTALLNAVSKEQTTSATAMNSLLQQVGGSLGIALSGVIHTFITKYYIQKHSAAVSEHYALQDSFLIAAFIILMAILPAIKLPEKKATEFFERAVST